MQATISGATHKVKVYDRSVVDNFLSNEKAHFLSLEGKSALYQNKKIINTTGLNYINILPDDKISLTLKNLLLKEYNSCEKLYPYLGDVFLEMFFKKRFKLKTLTRYEKRHEKNFLNSLRSTDVSNKISWVMTNTNLERTINIQESYNKDISLEMEEEFSLKFGYDYDFYSSLSNLTFRKYKFIIIDGYIESIGEIHHLFTKASENKIPYVFFCYGMSEEVKHNILLNNRKGNFCILPVSLDTNDENTLNILNDIAVLHNSEIVSSNLGQTISQEVRKDLPEGNKITFYKNAIHLNPVAAIEKINKHKKFLIQRLDDAISKGDVNLDPIKNRIKNFSMKKLNIYLPQSLSKDNKFQRELVYSLAFLKNINREYKILSYLEREYYIPKVYIDLVVFKVKSLKRVFEEIEIILT